MHDEDTDGERQQAKSCKVEMEAVGQPPDI